MSANEYALLHRPYAERQLRSGALAALTWITAVAAAQPPAGPAVTEEPPAAAPAVVQTRTDSVWSGSASLGARGVDVAGTEKKYREDVNLDDGVRLFGAHLSYVPRVGEAAVDRLDLDVDNVGGDPFQSLHLGVRKYGAYHLRLDRRGSEYFYDDTILPASVASVTGSTGGDFHRFDFERVRSMAALDIEVAPATTVSLGLERQTRRGDSATTLTVERDEFELERPIDESLNSMSVGLRHAWKRLTLIVDEQLRDFENASELFLPGASPGTNVADAAELQLFVFAQSYDYDSVGHSVRVLAQPADRLDVTMGWRIEDLDLDHQGSEQTRGTSVAGAPLATSRSGAGVMRRDIEIADIDLGFALTDRVRLVGGARHSTLEQQGDVAFGAAFGASAWDIATDGVEVGAEVELSPTLLVAGGWSSESRATVYGWLSGARGSGGELDTRREGYFTRLVFSPADGVDLSASVEDNSIDDPFTLASPTASRRYKLGARRRWSNGLSLSGNYRHTDVDNEVSNWFADTEQADVRLVYQRPRLQVAAGYTRVDLARSIEQTVTAGTRLEVFAIDYAAESSLRDTSVHWQLNDRFAIGGTVRGYDNHGSFPLARDDLRVLVDVRVSADYAVQISYRDVDYAEDPFDGYDAQILEMSFGLYW